VRFILIDRIEELVPGKSIRAIKTFNPDEEMFIDHFPGFPVVPGVILTEMMAQAAGKCLAAEDSSRGVPMLVQIKSANFRTWVAPGQRSTIICEINSSREQFATARGEVEVEGRKAASAELLFTFVETTRFAPGYRDEVLHRFLSSRQ
jgi:3-hydroxyacyl-[acyl-carrier-protein] dehydratase